MNNTRNHVYLFSVVDYVNTNPIPFITITSIENSKTSNCMAIWLVYIRLNTLILIFCRYKWVVCDVRSGLNDINKYEYKIALQQKKQQHILNSFENWILHTDFCFALQCHSSRRSIVILLPDMHSYNQEETTSIEQFGILLLGGTRKYSSLYSNALVWLRMYLFDWLNSNVTVCTARFTNCIWVQMSNSVPNDSLLGPTHHFQPISYTYMDTG